MMTEREKITCEVCGGSGEVHDLCCEQCGGEGMLPKLTEAERKELIAKAEKATAGLQPGGLLTEQQAERFTGYLKEAMKEEGASFQAYLECVHKRLQLLEGDSPDETIRRVLSDLTRPGSDVVLALYAAFLERRTTRFRFS